jgi:hypothetical protein
MVEDGWYYADDEQAVGPFTRDVLAARLADLQGPDTLVHGPGLSDWQPAGEVPEFATATLEQPETPPAALWLVCLFFRPRVFFRGYVLESAPGLTALCAWVYGITSAIDLIEQQAMTSDDISLPDSWGVYWGFALTIGIAGALGYFAIGGWWYAVRLGWSGAIDPDRALARRVYLFASQVLAIPWLVARVYETFAYENPEAALNAEGGIWCFLFVLFPIWSCWNSYVGVRTAFVVRRGAALMWFLVLPSAFYGLFLIGAVVVLLAIAFAGPADVENPSLHDAPGLQVSYPGNWMIAEYDEAYDPNTSLTIEPFGDAYCRITIYASDATIGEELDATLADFGTMVTSPKRGAPFSTWGRYSGTGEVLTGDIGGGRYSLRAFVGQLPDGRLIETYEFYDVSIKQDVAPGFELIRSTCRVKK